MEPNPLASSDREQHLDEAVAEYLAAIDQRRPVDRQAWLARYPELAGYFADFDVVDRFVQPLLTLNTTDEAEARQPWEEETVGHEPTDAARRAGAPGWVGDCELVRELGRGGMGVVYEARQHRLNRRVALKMLLGDSHRSTAELRRLQQEAEVIALLDHPHVVPVYEVGEHEGMPYFTIKLIEGGSLADAISEGQWGKSDGRAAARLVAQVARAVHHAHQRGILHRDLKPSNILLERHAGGDPVPYVTDFGLARRLETDSGLTQSGAIVGTPSYMAPELVSRQRGAVTTAVDVYGLGAVLYALLTERAPFQGVDLLETLEQVKSREPVPPREIDPGVDRDLETICLKCLHKEPEKRYGSADAVADDLDRFVRGEVIRARPVSRLERAWRWCRRDSTRASLWGMGVVILALLAVMGRSLWAFRTAQADKAHDLARSVASQFHLVQHAVRLSAKREELRGLLRRRDDPARVRASLQAFLDETKTSFNKWFTWSADESLVNWFLLDPDGTIVADSFAQSRAVGKNYRNRDYARLLFSPDADRDTVEVALVFCSWQDDLYKFAVATRVWDGDRLLGLLAATVPIDSKMVALDLRDQPAGATVACPFDPSYPPPDADLDPDRRYVVVLHRDYTVAGRSPIWVGPAQARTLDAFARDPSLREDADHVSGDGGFVDYVRVGDSRFVVIVERQYPWLFRFLVQWPWVWGFVAAGLVGLAVLLARSVRRGRHERTV